ncbi:hypothetical protein GPECTOR_37g225 [Gonium pectorale]|uniref:8-oxo-dGTP diphosphatase n=1 Tax=Gonium pectorale TaxID=33097 RepID=A0A150GBL3_GONPE|nr:hypothetical protein GPECTOR_37g225 [Gonium pectorale]|eukprot:KXZ47219.1 hypothetical protein GPECTOR_37g225 [Gonium pectorale]
MSSTDVAGGAIAAAPGGAAATAGVRLVVVVGVALLDVPPLTARTAAEGGAADADAAAAAAAPPVRVLLAQRPPGKANAGLWEFPGGKVDAGETPEAALVRELAEELSIDVEPSDLRPLSFVSYSYPTFHLLMPLYVCSRWRGSPVGAEGQAVVWATAEGVGAYPLTPADVPLVPAVLAAMRRRGEEPEA